MLIIMVRAGNSEKNQNPHLYLQPEESIYEFTLL